MKIARLALAAVSLALAAALVLSLLRAPRRPGPQLLPDGTVVRLAKISYGKTHRIATGNFIQRAFGPALPDAAARLIGAKIHSVKSPADRLVVFFVCSRPSMTFLNVSDDDGDEIIAKGPVYQFNSFLGQSNFVRAFEIPLAPSLGRRLHLRLQDDYYHDTVLAQFDVPNPVPPKPSPAPCLALPISRNLGPVDFTLTSFASTIHPGRGGWVGSHPNWTSIHYEIPSSWQVVDLSIGDSSGDFYHPPAGDDISPSERDFLGVLSPDRAWDLHFLLLRLTNFSPNEVWTSPEFTRPGTNALGASLLSAQLMGFNLSVHHVNLNNLTIDISPNPNLTGFHPSFRLGDTALDVGRDGMFSASKAIYVCDFARANPPNPTRLTVTIASNLPVDLIVRPTR